MITHSCIKCDYTEMIPCAEICPAFQRYECPECGEIQWIKHSRLNPKTYSEDMVEVDEETRTIKIKEL